jgi:FHS family L-fucose permease-like MFS transporter
VPYLVIAGIFLAVAALIYFSPLPEVPAAGTATGVAETEVRLRDLWAYPQLVKGVIAEFAYVGAQVGVASFVIRFSQHMISGTPEKTAAHYLQMHLVGFMIGRFAGSAIMKTIPAPRLLGIFAAGSLVCLCVVMFGMGSVPVWAIVLVGFFHSIMFPTIFALGVKNLGPYTKLGSSLLVMAIIGGAIVPALMGLISDASNIQRAFIVPLLCHAYVLYFAVSGYKPARLQQRV